MCSLLSGYEDNKTQGPATDQHVQRWHLKHKRWVGGTKRERFKYQHDMWYTYGTVGSAIKARFKYKSLIGVPREEPIHRKGSFGSTKQERVQQSVSHAKSIVHKKAKMVVRKRNLSNIKAHLLVKTFF